MLPKAKEIVELADLKMQDAVDFLEEDLAKFIQSADALNK